MLTVRILILLFLCLEGACEAIEDATMHPSLKRSFIEYDSECEFPLQNLPWGVFSTADNVSERHLRFRKNTHAHSVVRENTRARSIVRAAIHWARFTLTIAVVGSGPSDVAVF